MLCLPIEDSVSAGCLGNPAPQCPSQRISQFYGSPYGDILGSRCWTSIIAAGRETEYSFLEIGFREEELWMLFSAVSGFCDTPMEKWDISCEVAGSSNNQREARAKAWS
jgi:hypothetical protein